MKDRDRSGMRGLRGPVMVITVGVLFALNNFTPYRFEETWPVLIIVAGLVSLLGRAVAPPPMAPPPPYTTYQPPVPPPAAAGGYRQTPYSQGGDARNDPRNDPRNNPGGTA
ncbi:MAG: DUF5668 domain-containing protein [Bryobacteraceae bacterium]|jgi:hypothetical protein